MVKSQQKMHDIRDVSVLLAAYYIVLFNLFRQIFPDGIFFRSFI